MGNGVRPVDRNRRSETPSIELGRTTTTHTNEAGNGAGLPVRESREAWVERGGSTGDQRSTGEGIADRTRAPFTGFGARAARTVDPSGAPASEQPGSTQPPNARPVIGARSSAVELKDGAQSKDPPQRSLPEIRYDSTDAGDFYCEHVYFVAQEQALASSSSVLSNSDGHRLVGFIHLPEDGQSRRAPNPNPTAADLTARHGDTRRVVGAAIAGYFNEAASRTEGPVRIMVSGFGPFMSYTNNPSGDFVSHRANIDAAMEQAFGSRLVGRPPAGADMNRPLSYQVRQDDGSIREVQVRALRLPVSDAALDPAQSGSIPAEMASFRPHAVISMGLRPGNTDGHYDVEGRADNGGLRQGADGTYRDQQSRSRTSEGHVNGSLRRAIEWARTHPVN